MKKLTKMAAGFSICLMAFTTSLFGAGKKVSIPNGAERFGLLKIVSTENNGSNDFVTKPVAKHVRESQLSWGDKSNINAPEPYYEKCIISYGDREIGDYLNGKPTGKHALFLNNGEITSKLYN